MSKTYLNKAGDIAYFGPGGASTLSEFSELDDHLDLLTPETRKRLIEFREQQVKKVKSKAKKVKV